MSLASTHSRRRDRLRPHGSQGVLTAEGAEDAKKSLALPGLVERALARRLISTQAEKHWSSQLRRGRRRLMGPLRELDLGHQLGLHKMHLARRINFPGERVFVGRDRLQ